jgi:hypothetical protein
MMIYGRPSWNSKGETGLLFEIKAPTSALDSFQCIDSIGSRFTKSTPVINLADSVTQNLYSNHYFIAQKYETVFIG